MKEIERRAFLKGVGWLVVTLGVLPRLGVKAMGDEIPFAFLGDSLEKTPGLDAWLLLVQDGTVVAFTGKAELGQGIKTALAQNCRRRANPTHRADPNHHGGYGADSRRGLHGGLSFRPPVWHCSQKGSCNRPHHPDQAGRKAP